jgi:hypothetical protein
MAQEQSKQENTWISALWHKEISRTEENFHVILPNGIDFNDLPEAAVDPKGSQGQTRRHTGAAGWLRHNVGRKRQ